jgi:hypothetical protein
VTTATSKPHKSITIKLRSINQIVKLVSAKRPIVDTGSVILAINARDAEWAARMQEAMEVAIDADNTNEQTAKVNQAPAFIREATK